MFYALGVPKWAPIWAVVGVRIDIFRGAACLKREPEKEGSVKIQSSLPLPNMFFSQSDHISDLFHNMIAQL